MDKSKIFSFPTETHGGDELLVTYRGTPGLPGKLYGPPENCYPPEPHEIELVSVLDASGKDILPALDDGSYELLCDEAYERFESDLDEYYAELAEYQAEARADALLAEQEDGE